MSKGQRNRKTDQPQTQKQVRKRLADVVNIMKHRRQVDADGEAFVNELWRGCFLLNEIETRRGEPDTSSEERRVLTALREEFDHYTTTLFGKYGQSFSPLILQSELELWRDSAAATITSDEVVDSEFGAPEIAALRQLLWKWRILERIDTLPRQLQRAQKTPPTSEAELQERFATLLIGSRVSYLDEYEIAPTGVERRRVDFINLPTNTLFELKLCASPRRRSEILEEVRSDAVLAADDQRLFFIIYDVCCVREPRAFEETLESFFNPHPSRSVCVRVVKH
jgi:hypothetical protein